MSEENTSSRSLPGRYRSRRPLLILIGLFLAVGGAVATLPGGATWQITTQLERLGARSVAMEKVVINPATGEITVTGFKSVLEMADIRRDKADPVAVVPSQIGLYQ